ncbi:MULTISPECIES: hybrid sensor histidine kinase/response regulator transcription factor [Maribacter]|uniref:histidine kinase n=1 Tax=Maribacter flavus TaxID=1658664 RepID=A0ABU7IDI2_9FLAO|nr:MULTISPECIES: hybrid sensor histidine kinase/response regulator transcription factor [Maribacter]MDC6403778.1 two-component regulator propeller domain-containing protein [Maribacter sp. PR66]MEE1970919.1 two-component regulator propeller domain-containing protein [Maribacter flavus]
MVHRNYVQTSYLIVSFFCSLILSAQEKEAAYNFLAIEESITQRAVSSIVQDNQGLIWMGTYGVGLNKYNGIDITTYKQEFDNPNSLNSSLVHTAYVDSSGLLWVGTETGLDVYQKELDSFKHVSFNKNGTVLNNIVVTSIVEINQNSLLIGSIANGLFKVDIQSLMGYPLKINDNIQTPSLINCLVQYGDETVYIGTNKGLYAFNGVEATKVLLKEDLFTHTENDELNIESLFVDDEGSLWMGTHSNGLIKFLAPNGTDSEKTIETFNITDERILTIVQAPDDRILCGTENDGLFVLSKKGDLVKNYRYDKFDGNSIKSNSVWSLLVDAQDRIWIGYYNKGVGVHDYNYDKFPDIQSIPNVENSLQSSSVTGILKDKEDRLWIAMDGGGIDVYDTATNQFIHLLDPKNPIAKQLNADDVQTIFMDSQDNIWVGTWNSGIYFLESNSNVFEHFDNQSTNGALKSNRVMSFSEDAYGKIWIGSFSNGLHFYSLADGKFGYVDDKKFNDLKTSRAEIRKVMVDRNNNIWVATTSGLFKRQASTKESFNKIELKPELMNPNGHMVSVDVIVSLFEDSEHNVWIGTDGAGVWKYNTTNNFLTWYNKEQGLQQETISTIIESNDGRLWMAGNKGLSCYDKSNQQIINYDINDGLLTNDFNFNAAFKDVDGTLYFGNYKGINEVRPVTLPQNMYEPQIYFTDFKVYNKSVKIDDKNSPLNKVISETEHVTLNHKQSVFTIEYIGINYTRPEKNQYAYYLEGFEEDWNLVGNNRSATYTNLSPGSYTFKLKAANNDGVWSNEIKTLSFTILAPWWKTKMAIILYLLTIIIFSSWLYRLVRARIREKRLVEFERTKRSQEEALNNKKIQFFTNISHEFRTPLTLILNPLKDIMSNTGQPLPKEVAEKHTIIYKNAARLKRLIDELMDFRKLQLNKFSIKVSKIGINDFVKEITDHFKEEALLKNIALLIERDETTPYLWSDAGMLEKVIFNILSNAFKVTPENGAITVSIFKSSTDYCFRLVNNKTLPCLEISIEDTGSGINQEEVKKIFDRFYQVKNMNSQYYGGTGIGLEVVRNFVELLKGEIIIDSEEAVGTKFRILLPLGNQHFKEDELLKDTASESMLPDMGSLKKPLTHKFGNKSAKTILIVEDNVELRSYLKQELSFDHNVFEASNGQQALDLANRKIPDLIITDVVMPEMDGLEFCSKLKKNIATSHIPIIMLTAKTMPDDMINGVNSGADVYLTKPFDMRLLNSYLSRLIENRQVYISKNLNDPSKLNLLEKTTELDKSFMRKVLDYLNKNIEKAELNVEHLAEDMYLSRSQLYRKIKAMTGLTPNELIRKVRLEKAKNMIETGCESIAEVGFKVGFSSPSYFSRCFKSEFGILPTDIKTK